MKYTIGRFFSDDIDPDKLIFNFTLFISGWAMLVLAIIYGVLRSALISIALLLLCVLINYAFMFLGEKAKNIKTLSLLYVPIIYIIMVFILWNESKMVLSMFPTYFFIAITFTIVLLEQLPAFIILVLQLVVDVYMIYNAIVVNGVYKYNYTPNGGTIYIRFLASIILPGLVCGFIISYRNRILRAQIEKSLELKNRASITNYAKDMFLVNVSHEIRTPLNAIMGTTELLMTLDTSDKVKKESFNISNASRALLSITNDLLNFTKNSRENITLNNVTYSLDETFNDLINMISIRFADYKSELFVDVDPGIPKLLYGDIEKIRQIVLNYMVKTVKSLENGKVWFRVRMLDRVLNDKSVNIQLVIDAKGSFREEQYGNSLTENELIELLVKSIGGNMRIDEDSYSKVYFFEFPQKYIEETPLVEPSSHMGCRVLVYENSPEQRKLISKIFSEMNVSFKQVENNEEFCNECTKTAYTHIMLAAEKYEFMKDYLKTILEPQSLYVIYDGYASIQDELTKMTIARPLTCISIDVMLSGRNSYSVRKVAYRGGFECPKATIMVVDDNLINLDVAAELLKKYKCKIITAASGKECLSTLSYEHVDMIFLDYMMPEMDGIDTLKHIRSMDKPELKNLPVLALTANAVSGAKEMFIDAGFDEYLSKPIEIEKFDRALLNFLPEDLIDYISEDVF